MIKGNVIKGQAKVIMSRFSGTSDGIHLTIEDDKSGCRIIELTFTFEEFAKAVTASYGDAEFEYYPNCPVGLTSEYKMEIVPFSQTWPEDRKAAAVALKPFEVDGWKGDISDLFNHHRYTGDGKQEVGFRRYIKTKTEN